MAELKKFTVFLDMDGVVANWFKGFQKLFYDELTPDEQTVLKEYFREHQFVEACPLRPRDFWEDWKARANWDNGKWWLDLEPLPWAKKLYDKFNEMAFVKEVAFLTSPGKDYTLCWEPKRLWLKKHIGTDKIICTPYKYLCAREDAILVDDTLKHCQQFYEAGGKAFLWPNQQKLLEFRADQPPSWKWMDQGFETVSDIEEELMDRLLDRIEFDLTIKAAVLNTSIEDKLKLQNSHSR